MSKKDKTILVIGAGVAGLSCIEALFLDYNQTRPQYSKVILLSNTRLVKRVVNYKLVGRGLETFDVKEEKANVEDLKLNIPDGLEFQFILGTAIKIEPGIRTVFYHEGLINYHTLCLCLGARPRKLDVSPDVEQYVITIRDTDTVQLLQKKLTHCKRLAIVGNGGISLELVSKIRNCEKIWIVRDEFIGLPFFDSEAAKFVLESTADNADFVPVQSSEQIRFSQLDDVASSELHGPALGPNWTQDRDFKGICNKSSLPEIVYQDEIQSIVKSSDQSKEFLLKVITKKGEEIHCDLVASAIGVSPNCIIIENESVDRDVEDNGILIDTQMRTSIEHIYAAGDVISCANWPNNDMWFQKRLWTQARQTGFYAGRCIAAHLSDLDPSIYFNFDCFTHCTHFFGFKLVLLGRYNAQNYDAQKENLQALVRFKPGIDYVKILINQEGRLIGAILLGDSGLEETIENLIHDRIDVSEYKDHLLDGSIDIEDYFD